MYKLCLQIQETRLPGHCVELASVCTAHLAVHDAVHHRACARLLIEGGGGLTILVDPQHAGGGRGVGVVVHEDLDCATHSHARAHMNMNMSAAGACTARVHGGRRSLQFALELR